MFSYGLSQISAITAVVHLPFALTDAVMKSTADCGSFGDVGKCPRPSVSVTVIFPPKSLSSTTRVLLSSHGSRLPQAWRIGTPCLGQRRQVVQRLRFARAAAEIGILH